MKKMSHRGFPQTTCPLVAVTWTNTVESSLPCMLRRTPSPLHTHPQATDTQTHRHTDTQTHRHTPHLQLFNCPCTHNSVYTCHFRYHVLCNHSPPSLSLSFTFMHTHLHTHIHAHIHSPFHAHTHTYLVLFYFMGRSFVCGVFWCVFMAVFFGFGFGLFLYWRAMKSIFAPFVTTTYDMICSVLVKWMELC